MAAPSPHRKDTFPGLQIRLPMGKGPTPRPASRGASGSGAPSQHLLGSPPPPPSPRVGGSPSPQVCMEPPSSAAPRQMRLPQQRWGQWGTCPQSSHPPPGSGAPPRYPCTGRVRLPRSHTPIPTPAQRRHWVGPRVKATTRHGKPWGSSRSTHPQKTQAQVKITLAGKPQEKQVQPINTRQAWARSGTGTQAGHTAPTRPTYTSLRR